MKTLAAKLYNGFGKTKLALVLLCVAAYGAVTLRSGGHLLEMLWFLLIAAVYLVIPGVLAACYLQGLPGALKAPLAVVCECGILGVTYLLSTLVGTWLPLYLVPALLSAFYLLAVLCPPVRRLLPGRLTAPLPTAGRAAFRWRPAPHQWLLALLFGALLVLYAFDGVVFFARPSAVGEILPSQDLLWNVGNAASFKLGFPPVDIRFDGVSLRYHYFTEMMAGVLSQISGVSCYNILAFYLQPLALAALVLCLYRLGLVVFKDCRIRALLLVFLSFFMGCATLWTVFRTGTSIYWNLYVQHLVTNLNSQATCTILLSIFCALFVWASRQQYRVPPMGYFFIALTFGFLCLSKGPVSAIVFCALALTLLIGLLQRRTGWRGLVLGFALAAVFCLVYGYMYTGGAGSSVQFNPTGTLSVGPLWGWLMPFLEGGRPQFWLAVAGIALVQTFLTIPAQFPLFLYGLAHDVRRFARLEPERLLFNGAAVGGLAAYYLFAHYGMSQMYFLFAGIFFANLLAVEAAARLWEKLGDKRAAPGRRLLRRVGMAVVCLCVAVGLCSGLLGDLYIGGSGARQLLRNEGRYPQKEFRFHPATADDEAAALWLRENAPQNAVFATNRVYESYVSQFFSALSERQGYMEGHHYTKTNMGVADEEISRRWGVLQALFGGGTVVEEIAPLARENGIDYLVYVDVNNDIGLGEVQFPLLEQVFTSDTVRIYWVPS